MCMGRTYGRRVDVYAFGVMFYELLTKAMVSAKLMLDTPSKLERYVHSTHEGHRNPIPSYVPKPLADLISDCWAHDDAHRPTADQLLKRLLKLQENGVANSMSTLDRTQPCEQCCAVE